MTVDIVVLTIRGETLHVLLVRRGNEPYGGDLALPGGFVRPGEDLDQAARRELVEETDMDGGQLYLEQLRTYAAPDRDSRGRVVTVAYLAVAPDLPVPVGGTDALEADWVPVSTVGEGGHRLAFDHEDILRDGVERARSKIEYTSLATAFCPDTFTIAELRRVYEVIWGFGVDAGNFHRKVTSAEGFLEPTGFKRAPEVGRPAATYRRGPADLLHPAMLRARAVGQAAEQEAAAAPV